MAYQVVFKFWGFSPAKIICLLIDYSFCSKLLILIILINDKLFIFKAKKETYLQFQLLNGEYFLLLYVELQRLVNESNRQLLGN